MAAPDLGYVLEDGAWGEDGALTGVTPSGTFANSYYRFFARTDTQIVATITDTEDPACSTSISVPPCGGVSISVLSADLAAGLRSN